MEMKIMAIRLPAELHKRLKVLATQEGISLQEYITKKVLMAIK